MAEELKLRRLGVLSPFDEARIVLERWEREYPNAIRLALIVDEPEGFEYQITGEIAASEAAGLFFRCAQLVAE